MTSDENDDLIERILDARHGGSAASAAMAADVDTEIVDALEVVDLAWEAAQSAPPLADDPVAAMLGLIPDPALSLDGRALASARRRAHLSVSDLASRLSARGWKVSSNEVFRWENGRTAEISPALIRAAAEEVGASADAVSQRRAPDSSREPVRALTASPAFRELAARWARVQGTTVALATSALQTRALAAVHRGGAPEPEVILESLEALVSAVEDGDEN